MSRWKRLSLNLAELVLVVPVLAFLFYALVVLAGATSAAVVLTVAYVFGVAPLNLAQGVLIGVVAGVVFVYFQLLLRQAYHRLKHCRTVRQYRSWYFRRQYTRPKLLQAVWWDIKGKKW